MSVPVTSPPRLLGLRTAANLTRVAKRRCLGDLEAAIHNHVPLAPDLLAAISDGDPQRDIPSYLTESSMLNWHSDLWAVSWKPEMSSTFTMGLCAEAAESVGWALGVECGMVAGLGENVILFEGPLSADEQLKESAWVAMALVKTRLKRLRKMFTGREDVGEDLFDPKSDIKLQINPTNFMKQGASLSAAMFVSMVALGTGCSTKPRVAMSTQLNGQLDPVSYEEAKARGAKKGESTTLLLPPRFIRPPSERTEGGAVGDEGQDPTLLEEENVTEPQEANGLRQAKRQKISGTEGAAEGMEGLEVVRVRDMWDLALAAIQPMPGVTLPTELSEQQRGQLDPDCFYGCASAATYFLYQDAKALSATIQEIECIIYPSGSGGTITTGAVGPMTAGACHAAVTWLSQSGVAVLGDSMQFKDPRKYIYHFHYPPYDLPSNELHLGPTAYMALISAVTGWKANKKVSILSEVGMSGYFLTMLKPLGRFDIAVIGSLEVDTLIVPSARVSETRQAWEEMHKTCGPQQVVGCKTVMEAALWVFPEYKALMEEGMDASK